MKKITYLFIIILYSCNSFQTKQQIAQRLIKKYLDSSLNNPRSYEDVSFGKLYRLKDTVGTFQGKTDSIKYNGLYQIQHTYRATNNFGAIITTSEWFQIDSAMTKAMCCFMKPYSFYK